MEETQLHPLTFPALISLFTLLLYIAKWFLKPAKKTYNFPPSPPKLPILGNLHQVGSLPHRNLHVMAQKYGPIMLLHLGNEPVLVVSSADAAREIMRTHDLTFADRPIYKTYKKLIYEGKDVSVAPYGEYWKKNKSMFVLELLNSKKVQSFRCIREEETALFLKKIGGSSGMVLNLSKMFYDVTIDGICRSAFRRRYSESENGKKFLGLLRDLMELLGAVNVGDFIPWLSWISSVNGFNRRVDKVARRVDEFLESVIQEHLETPKGQAVGDNFLDIMLESWGDKNGAAGLSSLDRDSIKALILDIFIGGTDTVSAVLEWAMTELLSHPAVMEKLQKEVRETVKDKPDVTDQDLGKMDYLKAVIKETLRRHPPLPLLVPRIARNDVNVRGYGISAGTVVVINAFAIGRVPESWNEPEKFKPERFLNSNIDFKGLDFELIPFGAGRRACPGTGFATATIELVLANLVQKFNWEGARGNDLDSIECPGVIAHRTTPLLAVATHSE